MKQARQTDSADSRFELEVLCGLDPRRFAIPPGETIIGSSPACQFSLAHPSVSPTHCRLERKAGVCSIEDAGSTTKTFVNARPVAEKHRLANGDIVHLGTVCLRFMTGESSARSAKLPSMIANGRIATEITLAGSGITIGRDVDCDVILPSPAVSRKHARIEVAAAGATVVATNDNGDCLVNGRHFDRHQFVFGDQLTLGPYRFEYDGNVLRLIPSEVGANLVANEISVVCNGHRMIDRISLHIEPNEFVGIIGPTGAGKSTLLHALSGLRPADTGSVLFNGNDLYANVERYRREFGWVPQEDIVHKDLTVADALLFAAKLRLPRGTPAREMARLVNQTAARLSIADKMTGLVGALSGGETKKVSVAVELLCRPHILFLDEPTSGLDPGAESRLMELLRQLADGGCTVVCTTHTMQSLYLLDRVIVLSEGEAIFSGPPELAQEFFGVREMAGIFSRIEERSATEWRRAFESIHAALPGGSATVKSEPLSTRRKVTAFQPAVIFARAWTAWSTDWRNFAILLSQPVLIGLLLALAVSGTADDSALKLFFVSVATLWFGCSNGAQQIIGELPIYRRERMAGLHRSSYFFAKWLFLSVITLIQSALLFAVTRFVGAGVTGALDWQLVGLAVMALVATGLGLAISAVARSVTQAVLLVPLLIIPQIVLSGFTVPASEMKPMILKVSEYVPSFQLQRTMDTSLIWGKVINAQTLEQHLQAVQNLNITGQAAVGTVFDRPDQGLRALFIQGCWAVVVYVFAFVVLGFKEREY